jgi:hypothetical protein
LAPLLVLVLCLSGCQYQTSVVINSAEDISVHSLVMMSYADAEALAGELPQDQLCENMLSMLGNVPNSQVTTTDNGTHLGCEITQSATIDAFADNDGIQITQIDGSFVFTLQGPKDAEFAEAMSKNLSEETAFSLSVTFPGPVTSVTSTDGTQQVDGNTVTWTSLNDVAAGLQAFGDESPGLPTWAWYTLFGACLLLVAVGIVLIVLGMKKRAVPATA